MEQDMRKFKKRSSTLCWDCKHAYGTCSWAKDFIPVDGWKAIKTEVSITKAHSKRTTESYEVLECPLYEKG